MANVRIAGTGMTAFGEHAGRTGRDLFAEAGIDALEDAQLDPDDIEELYYGNFMGELAEHQGHQAPLFAEAVGIDAPATRFEAACASGGTAVRAAVQAVRNGEADAVLVGGTERMTDMGTAGATDGLSIAADDLYEIKAGMTFPGAYALMASAYLDAYDADADDLAHIAVKNHDNAVVNEKAHFQSAITVEDALEAPRVASPLGLYDACPISDGAAAVVLTSESFAADHDLDAPVTVTGTGQGTDNLALQDRESLYRTPAAETAAETAYAEAGITAEDVDCAEVHDCFTIAEVLATESLGFFEPGEGLTAAKDGKTTRDGSIPVNLSGGLKAKGHPVGATGVAQIAELTKLLAGTHARSDALDDPSVGIAHNAGGTVATATVHVLERTTEVDA
ncbi:thiolase domain-containing protein [Natronomonas sp. CBA1123]|jgi:acetyl-CoA C-acetyltransferase/acetyl-CoA acyltransferase|uniref:thiolase domain-containing protein n=1 Tax=Natronomonas sp. CBA1123 TaxID=2668070 RepID=UPI0012EA3DA0|nr:thiolase domain-containing protein [Natronomonas sp. CBA1123]MUV87235.1 thiolase domain-containing protein [Natronomonas sp. CBA1123]